MLREKVFIQQNVVVACDEDLEGVRVGIEPVEAGLDLGEGAVGGEVAGVNEDVAVGEDGLAVVGVGDADDAGVVGGFGGWSMRLSV